MPEARKIIFILLVIAGLVAAGAILGTANTQRADVPKTQNKIAMGEENAKQLLLLMDTDKTGDVTKQEWMRFMEAEFDRLDKDKTGKLHVKELTESQLHVSVRATGK